MTQASAWLVNEFSSKDDYSFDLQPRHLDELETALRSVAARDLQQADINPETFVLPSLGDTLAALKDEVVNGRGLALLRGFPVHSYTLTELETLYWGLGT